MGLKREQETVINFNDGNILVSASAGSGKTFAMIERAVRLISEGKTKVSEILAVTFTETAAYDMKEKLKSALIKRINESEENSPLKEEIKDVDYADICTIHSFSARLIRQYFFEAGVSPDFSVLDESDATVLKHDCLEKTFRELYERNEEWFLSLCDRHAYKRKDDRLKELILALYSFCGVEANPEEFAVGFIKNYTESGFSDAIREYKSLLNAEVQNLILRAQRVCGKIKAFGLQKGTAFIEGVISDLYAILNAESIYVVKEFEPYKRTLVFEQKLEGEPLNLKTEATEIRDELKEILSRYNKHLTDEKTDRERTVALEKHAKGLIEILKLFSVKYAEEKREEYVLDFSDLEHFALKVLSNVQIASAVKQKYKYVFADEYQDVNGVQEQILRAVSNGNLFMVGDVKQSIYGFRGCRPEIFTEKFLTMNNLGETTAELNYNFRSSEKVIETVNEIFSYCMKKDQFGVDYKSSACLKSGGIYPLGAEGRAKLHFLEKDKTRNTQKETPRIYDILSELNGGNKDDDGVSALIARIIEDELGKTYFDVKGNRYKNVTLGDIAILTRNKNNEFVSKLVHGLTLRGINVFSDVSENVCEYPEVKTLISFLRLIDYERDDIALATVMLGVIGGFCEQDLVDIVSAYNGRRESFYSAVKSYVRCATGELKDKLVKMFSFMDEMRFFADFNGAYRTLNKVVTETGYENTLLASNNGAEKLKRVKRFLSASKKDNRDYTVKEFLIKIDNSPESFKLSPCAEENALKVMTIHSSKGLEFPVVIVCGLERRMNETEEHEEVLLERNTGIALKYYDDERRTVLETPLRGLVREKMRKTRVKEELRLFYVATTRAEYSLHLVFSGDKDQRTEEFYGAKRFIDYVPNTIQAENYAKDDLTFYKAEKEIKKVLLGKLDEKLKNAIRERLSFVYPFSCDTVLPLKSTVTGIVAAESNNTGAVHVLFDDGFTDKESGTIAHKILENIELSGDFDTAVNKLLSTGVVSEEELRKVNLERIKNALKCPVFDRIKDANLYREKSFLVNVPASMLFDTQSKENVLVQGVIDLLAIKDNTAYIIDYKYSTLENESLKKKYKKQLDLYAFAVESSLKIKVESKTLVNIFSGEAVELE